jgi:predicted lipoprotein with Yx(FWY)xxD motif
VNKRIFGIALLATGVLGLAIAGCGGSSSSSSSESETASSGGSNSSASEPAKAAPNADEGTTFVSLGNVAGLGMVLVNSEGVTLYDFRKDQGTESSCYGACEGFWPPLLTKAEPLPSNGASASELGTTERKDGKMQVTYAGHPLYTFVEDTKPGEANGNNLDKFGGEWYALNSAGEEPTTSGGGETTTEGGTTTESSSGGYGGY